MNSIIKLLLTAVAVLLLSNFLGGVSIDGYGSAIIVALVLAVLNLFVKPILVILTLPITIVTLGLFLLVINALIIQLASWFIGGFEVDSFWIALLFSILLTILQSILHSLIKEDKK